MAKAPGFIFYPGDYLRDTQCLSEKVQVAYDRIMCEHMRNICITHQQLVFFTKRLNYDEVAELMQVLTERPEGFQITWVADSILKYNAFRASRSSNRKGKNKEHLKNTSETYEKHMENENEYKVSISDKDINTLLEPKYPIPAANDFFPVYEKMMGVFLLKFSGYFREDEKDFIACQTIAGKVEKVKGWGPGSSLNGHLDEMLAFWSELVDYIAGDSFLLKMDLAYHSTKGWQRLGQHMAKVENPEAFEKGKKDPTAGMSDYEKDIYQKRQAAKNKKG